MRRLIGHFIPKRLRRSRRSVIDFPPSTTAFRHSILQAIIAVRLKHQEVTNRCSALRCDILGCLYQGGHYRGVCGLSGNEQDTLDDQARLYAASYLRDMYSAGGLLLLLTFLQLLSQRIDIRNMRSVKTVQHRGENVPLRYECPTNLSSAVASILWAASLFPAELLDLRRVICQSFGDDWCKRAAENQLPNAPVHARIYHLMYTKQVREPPEKDCLLLIEEMFQELKQSERNKSLTSPLSPDAITSPSIANVRGSASVILPKFAHSNDPRISALSTGSIYEPRARREALKIGHGTKQIASPVTWNKAGLTAQNSTETEGLRIPGSLSNTRGMFVPAPVKDKLDE